MNMVRINQRCLVPVLAVAAVAGNARANLIVNGGFETGDFTGWDVSEPVGVSVIADGFSGSFGASFSSGQPVAIINQTVTIIPNATYRLEFAIKNFGLSGDGLSVSLGEFSIYSENPVSHPLESWDYVTFEFEAFPLGGTERLFSVVGFDETASFVLDDISLTLVPTPGTLSVLAAAGVIATRRRRS